MSCIWIPTVSYQVVWVFGSFAHFRFPDMVEQLIENSSSRKSLHDTSLRKIPDLESLSIKLSDKRAGLADLYKIYMAVKEVEKMAEIFRLMKTENQILNEHFGVPFVRKLDKMEKFQVNQYRCCEQVIAHDVIKIRGA